MKEIIESAVQGVYGSGFGKSFGTWYVVEDSGMMWLFYEIIGRDSQDQVPHIIYANDGDKSITLVETTSTVKRWIAGEYRVVTLASPYAMVQKR